MNLLKEIEHKIKYETRKSKLNESLLPEFIILDYETYLSVVAQDLESRYYSHSYSKREPDIEGDTFCGLKVSVLLNVKIKTIEVR